MRYYNGAYMVPEEALKKLQRAKKVRQPVYIYGASGYGKTTLVQKFLAHRNYVYIACTEGQCDLEKVTGSKASVRKAAEIVVIDNIWQINSKELRQKLRELIERENQWVILIGRSKSPSWLQYSFVKNDMMVISEDDLRLDQGQIREMLQNQKIHLTDEQIEWVSKRTDGNGFALAFLMQELRDGKTLNKYIFQETEQNFQNYMEKELLELWDQEVLEFLVQVSVVDSFDAELAAYITGNSLVLMLIERALDTGNFMIQEGTEYRLRPVLLKTLRIYGEKIYGRDRLYEYMHHAGLYYETRERLVEALQMYEQCQNRSRMREILIRNARLNPAMGFYYEFRKYYLGLSVEDVENSPTLMAALSMLNALMLRIQESEEWYERIREVAEKKSGSLHREAVSMLAYLDIGLPQRDVRKLSNTILHMAESLIKGGLTLPEFAVTGNIPSVMNGGKDFAEWSLHDRELAAVIGRPLSLVLGKFGKGLINAALAESLFEKGEDDFNVIKLLSKAQIEAESDGKPELLFAIIGIQSRISVLHKDIPMAKEAISNFSEKYGKDVPQMLRGNLRALSCRVSLYEDDRKSVDAWMKETEEIEDDFFCMERYRYLTRIRGFILNAETVKTLALIEKLRYYAEMVRRPMMQIELNLLEAIMLKRNGMEWREPLEQALSLAQHYRFVRPVSMEGAAILPLLQEYVKEKKMGKDNWWKQVMDETERMAKYYPNYLSGSDVPSDIFGANALQILKMQASGMTIRQIAEQMNLSEATIKYHMAENYRKLNVKGKTEAIRKATDMHLI